MSLKDVLLETALEVGKYAAVKTVFSKVFSRYERPNYDLTPGLININRTNLDRINIDFDSDGYKLRGYYYSNNSNKLVIVCHGLKSGADDYLPFVNFFYNNGFDCFSFNYKGTYESEGDKTFGMSESLVDLNNALRFIKSDKRFNNKKIYLFGHSWGGFAVCAVLNLHKDIEAVASVSGFNDAASIIVDKGMYYGGEIAALPKKYIDLYQEETFKDYLKYNALGGINSSKAKVLLAHGSFDLVIDFNKQSIISKINEITNPNINCYVGNNENRGHDAILYSKEALKYRKIVKKELKKYDDESLEYKEYIKNIDHYKYSEPNMDLFDQIIKLFK